MVHPDRPDAHCDPALDDLPQPVVTLDARHRIIRWNGACEESFGVATGDVLERFVDDVLILTDRDISGRFPERQWALCEGRRLPVEVVRWSSERAGCALEHILLRVSTDRLAHERETERVAELLRRQARSDALTGLANRYELEEVLAVAMHDRQEGLVALVVVDLDRFKPINDAFGHAVGDEVLVAVAGRLRSSVRDGDLVARLGGDEFVILTMLTEAAEPADVTRRVRQALHGPVTTTEGALTVGASVGIAVGEPGSDSADLLRRADKAMYRVKLTRG